MTAAGSDASDASDASKAIERGQRAIGVVVTGDNHLSPALPRLAPLRRAERRARLRAGFSAAVDYAITRAARLFINTGDLFDTPTPANQDRAFVAGELARLRSAGITCVAIGGNHDTPRLATESGGEAPQRIYAELGALTYFPRNDALAPCVFQFDGLRLAVVGLSNNPVAPPGSDPLAGIALDDPDDTLAQADVGLLVLHSAIEGLCRPNEGERIVTHTSLAALPPMLRVVVAGHIHRYARDTFNGRGVIVVGASERMEFGGASGHAGFTWLTLDRSGLVSAEHIRTPEQPRADLIIPTSRLWPATSATSTSSATRAPRSADLLDVIRADVSAACTPETITRLRLTGPLTREQYHLLALRDILAEGQRQAFSFDLDTSGLRLIAPALPGRPAQRDGAGQISPLHEIERLVEERIVAGADTDAIDLHAAAALLIARLRTADRGAEADGVEADGADKESER
ncbi:MAG: metallophosphoesterase [Ktedonobacterales bacterium]